MARKPNADEAKMLPFAAWLVQNIAHRGYTVQRVADHAGMHVSHLHKIIKSYLPIYSQYPRPGYEKTVMIGKLFGDVRGALESAGYEVQAEHNPAPLEMSDYGIIQSPNFNELSDENRRMVGEFALFLQRQQAEGHPVQPDNADPGGPNQGGDPEPQIETEPKINRTLQAEQSSR